MAKLWNKKTGQVEEVDDADVFPFVSSGQYVQPDADGNLAMLDQAGKPMLVPLAEAGTRGSVAEEPAATDERRKKKEYSYRPIEAFGRGVARTLSFGLSDYVGDEEANREIQSRNQGASIAGEIGGAFLPIGAPGLIGKLGTRVAKGVEGAVGGGGLLSRAAPLAARGATEGTLFGAGTGVSQVALSEDPLSVEQALGMIGSNALYGGVIGAGAGLGGSLLKDAAVAGKSFAGRQMAKLAGAGGKVDDAATFADDVVRFRKDAEATDWWDSAGQRAAKAGRKVKGPAPAADIGQDWAPGSSARMTDPAPLPVTNSREIRQAYRAAEKADFSLRAITDNPKGLIQNPEKVRLALQKQEAALITLTNDAATMTGPKAEMMRDVLAKNQALQVRLDAMAAAKSAGPGALAKGAETAVGSGVSGLAMSVGIPAPLAFMVGSKVGDMAGDVLAGKLASLSRKIARGSAEKTEAMEKMVDGFFTAGGRGARAAPVLATKTLAEVSYGSPATASSARSRPYTKPGSELLRHFRDRSDEIRGQVMPGPDGKPVMRPEAMKEMQSRLAGLWAVAPKLADQVMMAAARKLEFLASKLPLRTEADQVVGPDAWQPSDMDMRRFGRYAAAAENPDGILDRFQDGSMTPEDAEVLRSVYPETFNAIRSNLLGRLGELQATLPYERRLMLSIMFDAPVDPSMRPENVAALQATFSNEPNTDGGMSPPAAKLGSIKKSMPEPTPAQRISG